MKTNKKNFEVAIHFNRTSDDFTFQCIDQIQTSTSENTDNLLIMKEAYWSAQLFSLSPFGLNKRQEFHSKKSHPLCLILAVSEQCVVIFLRCLNLVLNCGCLSAQGPPLGMLFLC